MILAGAKERELRLRERLGGAAPFGHAVAARVGGGTAEPLGSLCAATGLGQFLFCFVFYFLGRGTRGAPKCDAVSALNPLGGERTLRSAASAPNFGFPPAHFWNTA
jgi:hypothetical protein